MKQYTDKELLNIMIKEDANINLENEFIKEFAERLFKKQLDTIKINDPITASNYLKLKIGSEKREVFVAMHLDTQGNLVGYEEVFKGTIDSCVVHPREIFRGAILNCANSIIVAHNHPGGSLSPSGADLNVTKRLIDGGDLLGIEVLDHIIVTKNNFTSIRKEYGELW